MRREHDAQGCMRTVLHTLQRTSWIQRLFLLVLAANVILLLLGLRVVPAALSSADALGTLLGTIGMQGVLALLALVGPVSFAKYPRTMGISLGLGVLFALAYDGILACEFAGIQFSFDTGAGTIYALFVGVSLLAGVLASLRTQRFFCMRFSGQQTPREIAKCALSVMDA